jgi:hypothetical protein
MNHLSEVLRGEAGNDRGQWRIRSQGISMLVELATGTENRGSWGLAEEFQDVSIKMSAQKI